MVPTLGALIVMQMLGNPALAGLSTSMLNISRFIVSYPTGWVADMHGRRTAMTIGLSLSLIGSIAVGSAVTQQSFPLFVLGMLLFGLGVGAAQQLRLAAADLYPPSRRAEGLGYVLTGSLAGALGGPVLISAAQNWAPGWGLEPAALAWLLVPVLLIPSMGLVWLIRPDPREIARNIRDYFPDEARSAVRASNTPGESGGIRVWLASYPMRVAFTSTFVAQGVMTMMMAMTPLALAHHGHELPMISLAVALHVVGMFGLSLPIGRLTDRVGRRSVLQLGVILSALGSVMVVVTEAYWVMTLGIVLVGVGWSCSNVAASALIADMTNPGERGRAIGTNDMLSGAGSIALPLIGGPLVAIAGLPVLALIAAVMLSVPMVMLVRLRDSRASALLRA
jgi:MFS family permease